MYKIDKSTNQLRSVILLLVIAVILPTVCLLWFMTEAMKNDRLALRQELIDTYTKRAERFFIEYPKLYWENDRDHLASSNVIHEHPWFFPEVFAGRHGYAGFLIFDNNGSLIWPIAEPEDIISSDQEAILWFAYEKEFEDNDLNKALGEYEKISGETDNIHVKFTAEMSAVRCLNKMSRFVEAVEICYKLAYPQVENRSNYKLAGSVLRAHVMLAELYKKTSDEQLFNHLRRVIGNSHYNNEPEDPGMAFPSEARVWALKTLLQIARDSGLADRLEPEIAKAETTIKTELLSLGAAEFISHAPDISDWPQATFRTIQIPDSYVFGIHYTIGDKTLLAMIEPESITEFWQPAVKDFQDEMVFCRIYDDQSRFVAGTPRMYLGREVISGRQFLTRDLGEFFPDWRLELYFYSGTFSEAAKRQKFIYFWIVTLVIFTMLLFSFLASRAVLKQARLNRLKNDFIATVTHELKTPLASMRVLVDTLLEGNYNDQQQATEYLQLISKENRRLSRLIDNFLTFSRMERNKQAFELDPADPADIATAAAEAVQTKFNEKNCKFTVTIDDDLPSILADKDAMVTVLVNLLDNAYKYSLHDKQIELSVFSQGSYICFSVKDNGIGMTSRQTKRVFDRFYQADNSLSRQAEGTGLGLSIVKFILDAHNATITVNSQPEKGSEFTVTFS